MFSAYRDMVAIFNNIIAKRSFPEPRKTTNKIYHITSQILAQTEEPYTAPNLILVSLNQE
jgi:hypothetical protein